MSDKILIRGLRVDAIIGIHDWEKQNKQPLLFDFDLSHDCTEAAHSDDINHALDYFKVCQQVTQLVEESCFELIEALAEKVADHILKNFPCKKVKLTLLKPDAIDDAETVGLSITRKA